MDLHFHRISNHEYRARVAAHDGTTWHHGVYVVRCTPELQRKDPFHAWQAESPEGFIIAEPVALGEGMKACNADVPSYLRKAQLDSSAVLTEPSRILEVL